MISFFGNLVLMVALVCALLQFVLPTVGFFKKNIYALAFGRTMAMAQLFFLIAAYLLLVLAFLSNDFSIIYVAANSHPDLPFAYKLTALWGAHEGSILLWILLLNLWTLAFDLYARWQQVNAAQRTREALVFAFLGMISVGFILFLLLTSNPFSATKTLNQPQDLNPLLQDPGFMFHPPMLYAGYVGFAVSYALTAAGLLTGQLDRLWLTMMRYFATLAWCFLTIGIMLGSWWAYRVLGWGGFWFWDPVENASLLPWLAGIALVHVLIIAEKRGEVLRWVSFIGLVCFSMSLLGTFLVRSGILMSVHAFANDPKRGIYLLGMIMVLFFVAVIIFGSRLKKFSNASGQRINWLSREHGLLLNSALLMVALVTILIGTLYPLILDALQLGTISVGAPYFNLAMLPLVVLALVFMGFVPYLVRQNKLKPYTLRQLTKKFVLSLILAVGLWFLIAPHWEWLSLLLFTLSVWVIVSVVSTWRTFRAMTLAHIGFALLVIGIVLSSLLSLEREVRIQPGQQTAVGPYRFIFTDSLRVDGANYRGFRANFDVMKNKHYIARLQPEKRIYDVRNMVMTKVDIHPSIFRDLYIALGEPLEDDAWTLRIYYKPFIRFIWLGGLMMALGGLFALKKRQVR